MVKLAPSPGTFQETSVSPKSHPSELKLSVHTWAKYGYYWCTAKEVKEGEEEVAVKNPSSLLVRAKQQ